MLSRCGKGGPQRKHKLNHGAEMLCLGSDLSVDLVRLLGESRVNADLCFLRLDMWGYPAL